MNPPHRKRLFNSGRVTNMIKSLHLHYRHVISFDDLIQAGLGCWDGVDDLKPSQWRRLLAWFLGDRYLRHQADIITAKHTEVVHGFWSTNAII